MTVGELERGSRIKRRGRTGVVLVVQPASKPTRVNVTWLPDHVNYPWTFKADRDEEASDPVELDEIQEQVGIVDASWPGETVLTAGLGLAEEICELDDALHALHHHEGKLCRAIVKREHHTRGTPEQWAAEIRKEAADVAIVLLDIARREGFSLFEAIEETVEVLRDRDVNHHPLEAT